MRQAAQGSAPDTPIVHATEWLDGIAQQLIAGTTAAQRGLQEALRVAAQGLGFDGAVVARVHEAAYVAVEWSTPAPGGAARSLPIDDLPALREQLLRGRPFVVARDSRGDAGLAAERALLDRLGVTAALVFPLQLLGCVTGCVAFWSIRPIDASALARASDAVSGAVTRQVSPELALRERLQLAELVGEVSRRFVTLTGPELDRGIGEVIERIGAQIGFDRVLVYRFTDDEEHFTITHRYVAPGLEVTLPLHVELPVNRYAYTASRLRERRPIVIDRDSLPDEAQGERTDLEGRRVHVVVFPLALGDDMLGAVTFEASSALPEPSVLDALRVISELFASAIDRERAGRELGERLQFEESLTDVTARLVNGSPAGFDAAVGHALGAVGSALDFDRVTIFELTSGGRLFTLAHEWYRQGIESLGKSTKEMAIDEFGWPLLQIREGRAMMFGPDDVPAEATAAQRALARDGTRFVATLPLVIAGEVFGCICFHRIRSGKRPSRDQLRRLRLVGETVAGAMWRRRAEDSLRVSEARFEQVIASALDGFVMVRHSGTIIEWTPQAERILGWPRAEMVGSNFSDLLASCPASTEGDGIDGLYHVALETAGNRLELGARHRNGYEVPVELSISPLESIEPSSYGVFIRDITDRHRAEQVRQRAFDEIARLKAQLEGERDYLREEIRAAKAFGDFIGTSSALTRVIDLVDSVAATPATVLVHGESGVGKELVARAIHARSRRADGPLVKVNCPTIPRELFESEFFGHVRGAFTGAQRDRVGRFELADGGTIFLDEVGEIPLELQSKLLRVLQESEFERVGDDRTRHVDVRVIAATNRDLEREVAAGRFRKDLYYRLSVFPIEVPPLRVRREDIVPLAEHFLAVGARNLGRAAMQLSPRQQQLLEAYSWPGNVRELEHVIARALILSREPPLRLDAVLEEDGRPQEPPTDRILTEAEVRELERANIAAAIERCEGRIAGPGGAAELLGINPSTLRDRVRAFGINRPRS